MCTVPVLRHVCRESYNQPLAVYEKLKRLGMDLVTVTDHDSIDAVEELRSRPDFFLSEEVTCTLPSGTQLHIGVYDITERDHIELQRRRNDFESLLAWLVDQDLFFSANHVFSSLTGRRTLEDFRLFETAFPALETLNGHMLARANRQRGLDWRIARPRRSGRQRRPRHGERRDARGPWCPARELGRNICDGLRRGHGARARGNRRLLEADARRVRDRRRDGARKPRDPADRRAGMAGSVHSCCAITIREAIFARWWMARYMQSCSQKRAAARMAEVTRMTLHGTMLNYISRRDHKLMRRINRWPAPRWVRLWALCATRGGDGWLWYAHGRW